MVKVGPIMAIYNRANPLVAPKIAALRYTVDTMLILTFFVGHSFVIE